MKPINMVLHCPNCGRQHIDEPEGEIRGGEQCIDWTNPPHRSHLCHGCGHIWRPADVPTNGVAAVKTKGKADSEITNARYIDPDPPGSFTPDSLLIRMHLANGTEIVGTNHVITNRVVLGSLLGVRHVGEVCTELARKLYVSVGKLKG